MGRREAGDDAMTELTLHAMAELALHAMAELALHAMAELALLHIFFSKAACRVYKN